MAKRSIFDQNKAISYINIVKLKRVSSNEKDFIVTENSHVILKVEKCRSDKH